MFHPQETPAVATRTRFDFGRVDLSALADRAGKAGAQLALLLGDLADDRGEVGEVAIGGLASRLACSRATMTRMLGTLKKSGLIDSKRTGGGSALVLRFPFRRVLHNAYPLPCDGSNLSHRSGDGSNLSTLASKGTRAHGPARLPTLPSLLPVSSLPSGSRAAEAQGPEPAAAGNSGGMNPDWDKVIAAEFGAQWVKLARALDSFGIAYDDHPPRWSIRALFRTFSPERVDANFALLKKRPRVDLSSGLIIGACRENFARFDVDAMNRKRLAAAQARQAADAAKAENARADAERASGEQREAAEFHAAVLALDPCFLRDALNKAIDKMPKTFARKIGDALDDCEDTDTLREIARRPMVRAYLAPLLGRYAHE